MPKTDNWPKLLTRLLTRLPADLAVAFALLTRLPLPQLPDAGFARQARATWAFALVGAVIGLLAGVTGWIAVWAGLPGAAAAGLILAVQIALSGAMHEDGLADTLDGLWGGQTRERRLEIMRDSAIGTYGVLGLIGSLGLRWVALSALLTSGLTGTIAVVIGAGALSRALLPAVMSALPHARDDGLSRRIGRPGWAVSSVAAGLGIALALLLGGVAALVPIGLACVVVAIVARIARARIGGQTGDILGACQQLAEIAMLLGFLAVI